MAKKFNINIYTENGYVGTKVQESSDAAAAYEDMLHSANSKYSWDTATIFCLAEGKTIAIMLHKITYCEIEDKEEAENRPGGYVL